MTAQDAKLFWTVQEYADAIRVDRRTVSQEIANGTIPAIKVGRLYRIPATWVQEQAGVSA